MNKRQENLLYYIIAEFLINAQPVGSGLLVSKYYSDLSSATIRNEMATLEKEGYIAQPHTSAGRIPTEKGYYYYLENFIKKPKLSKQKQSAIDKILEEIEDLKDKSKNIAKTIASVCDVAVFVAFSKNDFYYTGISNLLAQPEFYRRDLILNISQVIDHFDEVLENIFNEVDSDTTIQIGLQNPFSGNCASIMAKYCIGDADQLIGILGPMRMNYEENIAIINYFTSNINNK